jgi:glycosyltransferase involved in cell wall biosynthesis
MNGVLNVLHVETGRHLYGGALQVLYLMRGLRALGVRNILVCPDDAEIAASARGIADVVHAVPMHGEIDLGFALRLRQLARRENAHLVHLHSRRGADWLGGLAARLAGTPCLLTRRVDNREHPLLARVKYRLFNHVAVISDAIANVLMLEGVPASRLTRIYSAVDADAYAGRCDREAFRSELGLPADAAQVCGVIAQLIPRKGHRHLLAALPRIVERLPRLHVVLFGRGPEEDALRRRCADLGIAAQVHFAGFRSDLPALLGCLDLVVHPAEREGLGVALLQAAAAGVPVVATDAGGIPEVVADGVSGLLVPPAEPGALADAVLRVLSDPGLVRRLGTSGRRLVAERFSIPAMAAAYLGLYRSLTAETRPGA